MKTNPGIDEDRVSEVFNFDGYFLFMRKDGIIHLQFKPGFVGGIEDAKMQVTLFKKLAGDSKAVILALYEQDNSFTKEAREFVASDAVSALVKAEAFVIPGLALRILANGYLSINRPKRPTRIFSASGQAIPWLKQFLDE